MSITMTEIQTAMQTVWSAFGYNAYLSGHVPNDAVLPYVTYEARLPDAFGTTQVTAIGWFNTNEDRAAFLDDVREAFPPNGTHQPLSIGLLSFYPATADFITHYDVPETPFVYGGRVALELRALTA